MNDSRALIDRESLVCFIYQSKKFIEERKLSIKKLFCFSFVVRTLDKIRCINNDQYFSTEKKTKEILRTHDIGQVWQISAETIHQCY